MKNIGLLISTLNGGGAERVVSHLSHILAEEYNVHVILFEGTYIEYQCSGVLHDLNVPSTKKSLLSKLNLLRNRIKKLKDVVKREKIESVISFLDSPNLVNILAKVKGCKRIISIRNYSSIENRNGFLNRIVDFAMKRLYKKADFVVTVSKLIEEDYKKHYGIKEGKISTIYNPYDFSKISEMALEPLSEKEFDFFAHKKVFCNVGRLMYQKGIWHLIKAFSVVRNENPDARLVLVGEDYFGGKVEDLIRALKLENDVMLVGRVKNPYKYMRNSYAYVLSSLFEGFPNAMVEAMVCGLPVISSDCKSGPREILCEEINFNETVNDLLQADYGILVPPLEDCENWDYHEITKSEKKLAEAMLKLANDKGMATCYSQLSIERSRKYSYDFCKEKYMHILKN